MKTITKEELVFRWLVAFGYKARVNNIYRVSDVFGIGVYGNTVRVTTMVSLCSSKTPTNTKAEQVLALFGVLELDHGAWHVPDEWFDEVLGVQNANNH